MDHGRIYFYFGGNVSFLAILNFLPSIEAMTEILRYGASALASIAAIMFAGKGIYELYLTRKTKSNVKKTD